MSNLNNFDQHLLKALQKRVDQNSFRKLPHKAATGSIIDFLSNDYLGIVKSNTLRETRTNHDNQNIFPLIDSSSLASGATGSRLLSGNHPFIEELEDAIARFHNAEASLIFNSGYCANVGLLSSLPTRHDTIIYDEYSHASIIDGARLSNAKKKFSFGHNDLNDLEKKILNASSGAIFVAVESVYSMEGDCAPLVELVALKRKYPNLFLIVDEAHGGGVFGENGSGVCNELGIEKEIDARVFTYGKAFGCHGAAVVGSRTLKDYLVNFARSFIYTTAMPLESYLAISKAYASLSSPEVLEERKKLFAIISSFREMNFLSESHTQGENRFLQSRNHSQIQYIQIPDKKVLKEIASHLTSQYISLLPILSPTVPLGKERLRVCLHSFNTSTELQNLQKEILLFEF